MSFFRNILQGILFLLNVVCSIGFLVSAYSPYISPFKHPVWACSGLAFPLFLLGTLLFLVLWGLFRRWLIGLPLLTLLLGWGSLTTYFAIGSSEEASEKSIKVLTYNVEGFPREKGEKEHSILAYLKNSQADIICLQEFRTDLGVTQKQVKRALSSYPYSRYTQLGGGSKIVCYSRFPILSAKRIAYQSEFNGSVLYKLKVGTDTMVVINNHLESNKLNSHDKTVYNNLLKGTGEEDLQEEGTHLLHKLASAVSIRGKQAEAVAKVIDEIQSSYTVVCGDFNDSPISYAHHTIGQGMTDAFAKAGKGLGISYNQGGFYFRIDHIFAGEGFRVCECKVDRSISSSDHYPVWCILDKIE